MDRQTLLPISRFAEFTGMSRANLIYYDEVNVFSPVSRGRNNYRYYAIQQITTLRFVRVLVELGVPLKAIAEIREQRTPEKIVEVLHQQRRALIQKERQLRDSRRLIETLEGLIKDGLNCRDLSVGVESLEEIRVNLGNPAEFGTPGDFTEPFLAFVKAHCAGGSRSLLPVGGYFDTFADFCADPRTPHRFFFVDPKGTQTYPAGDYLVGYRSGYYGTENDIHLRMQEYAKKHHLVATGPVLNVYLLDEVSQRRPEDYLMRAAVPIEAPES
jgi:DNA-binding transcriptional MerR regulator